MNKKIYVLTVVILDSDALVNFSTRKFDSMEDAQKAAQESLDAWMDNGRCFEEDADEDCEIDVCSIDRYGNLVEVHELGSIAEFNSIIYEWGV